MLIILEERAVPIRGSLTITDKKFIDILEKE
jgi:hypothetical protein